MYTQKRWSLHIMDLFAFFLFCTVISLFLSSFRNVRVGLYRKKRSKKYTQNFSHMEVSINWNCGLDLIANTKLYLISKNVSIVHIHIVNNSINIYHLNPWIV